MDKLDEIVEEAVMRCKRCSPRGFKFHIRTAIARVLEWLVNQPRDGEVPVKEIYDLAKQLREGK